jgi:hypothetical protein
MHRWWSQTACPGPYLASKFTYISQQVQKVLSGATPVSPVSPTEGGLDMKVYFVPKKEQCVLRSQANKSGAILATIPVGAEAEVFGFNRQFSNDGYEWARVKYAGKEGYCQMDTKVYWLISK